MYNYIPHPSNARLSSSILSLRVEEGAAGYGVYWMLLELLRDQEGFKYSSNYKALAFALNEQDVALVERVVKNYGLFDFDDDGLFFSPWLNKALASYSEKKTKLVEAGKRGAAKRWASTHTEDGQAIATPSSEDGQAIAYNSTQYNTKEYNKTYQGESDGEEWKSICQTQGLKVDDELLSTIAATQPEGHAPGYVAQICHRYGIGKNVLDYLLKITDNARLTNPRYIALVGLIRRISEEKYTPKYPANFICSKI